MNIKKGKRSYGNAEQYKRAKQAEAELDKRIRETSRETSREINERHQLLDLLGQMIAMPLLGVALLFKVLFVGTQETGAETSQEHQPNQPDPLMWIIALLILGVALFVGTPFPILLLVLLFFVFPGLCKSYGVIVGAFTIFSGIKLFFSGEYFRVIPALPFTIVNPSLSYFCLGWGLLVASRHTRSRLGFLLGVANLLGSGLGLFRFKQVEQIVAPGLWGAAISAILTIILGYSIVKVILDSYRNSKRFKTV